MEMDLPTSNLTQGGVNPYRQDIYYITYSHTDSSGNDGGI